MPIPDKMDTPTPMDTSQDKHNTKKADIDISWKEYIRNLKKIDIDSINEGKYMTCAIIRVMMKRSQEWLQKKGMKATALIHQFCK